MNARKFRAVGGGVLVLVAVSLLALVLVLRQANNRRTTGKLSDLLETAPCVDAICPGFAEGVSRALAVLDAHDTVQARQRGETILFELGSGQGQLEATGRIYFGLQDQPPALVIRRIVIQPERLSLRTALDALGQPDEYLFITGCGEGYRKHAKLLYVNRGVEVIVDDNTRNPRAEVLSERTPVALIEYFEPANYAQYLAYSLDWYLLDNPLGITFAVSVTRQTLAAHIRPWPGLAAAPSPSADFCTRAP